MKDTADKQDQIDDLKTLIGLTDDVDEFRCFNFGKLRHRIMSLLMKRDSVSVEALYHAMYHDRVGDSQPSDSAVSQQVHFIRKSLRQHGITVQKELEAGYFLSPAAKVKVKAVIEAAREREKLEAANTEKLSKVEQEAVARATRTFKVQTKIRPTSPYVIDKGIPIPPTSRGGTPLYQFENMEIGDSFLVTHTNKVETVRSACNSFQRRDGFTHWRFIVRAVEGGIRAWRSKDDSTQVDSKLKVVK